jgi:diguanylate cyclase (GGDEF)-like protein/PAS domain S-box-containing protein
MKKTDLRQQAEEKLSKRRKSPATDVNADTLRLLQELQVHQIELEMQNEELVQARAEAEAVHRQYTDLYDFAPVGYFTLTRDGTIQQVNLAGANLLGVERSKLINCRMGLFISVEYRPAFNDFLERLLSSQGRKTCELEFLKNENEIIWARVEATCFEGRQESRAVVSDISERKQAESALGKSELKYRSLIEASSDAIFCVDEKGQYQFTNQLFASTFGKSPDYFIGKTFWDIYPKEHADYRFEATTRVFQSGESESLEVEVPLPDKTLFFYATANPIKDETGKVILALTHAVNITERKHAEDALRHLSTHDALTGLYNRGFFMTEMERIERGRQFPVSIVMADVDDLKKTNDQEGHAAGDTALKRIAESLTAAFRSEDVVARIGGDEFAVLLPNTDAATAKVLLGRVQQVIQENNSAHAETPIQLSLGVSTAENPMPLSVTLKKADVNMYREKRGNDAT